MSKILTYLRAALEEKREAHKAFISSPVDTDRTDKYRAWESAHGRLHALLTDDTIAQLIAVAQAAEHEPRCPFCAEERHIAGWPTQPHLSDCPLAPLVKEASDE